MTSLSSLSFGRTSWMATAVFLLFVSNMQAQTSFTFPVNILEGLQNGQIAATHSALDIGSIENAFDGNVNNVARSAAGNPMVVTLQFSYLFHITQTSFTNNSESTLWTVESAQNLSDLNAKTGSWQKLVDAAPHSGFAASTKNVVGNGKFLRLTMQKLCCDNFVHLQEWGITATANITVTNICMKPNQVRLIPNSSFQPAFFAVDASGNEFPVSSGLTFGSSNSPVVSVSSAGVFSSSGNLGEANVSVNWNGLQLQTKVKVVGDFVSPAAEKRVVNVAMVIIDPHIPAAGGQRFSEKFWSFNGGPMALAQQTRDSMFLVSGGTIDYQFTEIHEETDLSLNRFGGHQISVDSMYKLFLQPGWPTLHLVAEQQGNSQFLYNDLLNKYNLCDKSNSHLIDEIWVWAMPFIGMGEAAMTGTGAFNINGPVFGGNSCTDLLPIMGFNYERYAGCALHNFVHRFETTMYKVFPGQIRYTPADPPYPAGVAKNALQEFMLFDALEPGKAQLGNSHFLPNGTESYDYDNPNPVPSGAVNWKRYPFIFSQTAPVSCPAWGCEGDCGLNSQAWWMRHVPHFKCTDKTGRLNNWWTYFIDFNEGKALEAATDHCNCKLFDDDLPPNCASKGDFPWHEWISRVKIGDLNNPSGKSQFSDFTAKTLHLTAGTAYSLALSTGFSYFGNDEFFRVWIDKNKDGIFQEAEKIAEGKLPKPADGTPESTLNLTGLMPFPAGAASVSGMKMRVSMKRGGYPAACETIPFGEVEDYSVDLGSGGGAKPDLSTTAWEIIPANSTCFTNPGQAMTFFAGLVRNPTTVAATAFKVKAWLSKDNAIGAGDISWQTISYPGAAPDAALSLNINAPIPVGTPSGNYFALVQVDADSEVAETDEANNLVSFTTQVGAPDFIVQNVGGIPSNVQAGSGFTVTFEVKNQATFPLNELPSGGFEVPVFLSTDNVLQIGTDPVVGLATILPSQFNPGGVASQLAGVTIPAGTAAGSYFLFVRENASCELNFLNNTAAPVPLQIMAPQGCSLSVQVSNVVCAGTSASATVLVTPAFGGGPQGWIGSYSTPGGVSFVTGAYGVPSAVSVFKNLTANSVPLNIFDPVVSGCTAIAAIDCPTGQVCESKSSFPWEDWIGSVKIGVTEKTSGKSPYSDFTATSFLVANGATATLTTAYSYFAFDEYWRIWIDLNKDSDFADAGEKVFEQILQKPANGTASKSITGPLNLPAGNFTGTTRMRVSMKRGAFADPCEALPFGEVEDFTAQFGGVVNLPDLQLANLNFTNPSVPAGQILNYKFDLKNTGTGPATGNFNIKAWISTDNVLSGNDIQDGVVPTGNLAAGVAILQVAGASTIPANLPAGQYFLILKADADGQISESNEGNNELVSATKFTVQPGSGGSGADLELTLTADKTNVPIYSNVAYTLTARNNGNQPISSAKISIGVCLPNSSLVFSNATGLVYAGTPAPPSAGSFDLVAQLWTLSNLLPGQSAALKITLFTMTAAERKVIAFSWQQTPVDPDSQPGQKPANCTPTQDDEAVWTINTGQTIDNPDNRDLPKDLDETIGCQVFPNPAGDFVLLSLKSWVGKPATVSVFNQLGVLVSEIHFEKITAEPESLDLSKMNNGNYFLKMETPGERTIYRKLVVIRTF